MRDLCSRFKSDRILFNNRLWNKVLTARAYELDMIVSNTRSSRADDRLSCSRRARYERCVGYL
jgi:hypothetical protein